MPKTKTTTKRPTTKRATARAQVKAQAKATPKVAKQQLDQLDQRDAMVRTFDCIVGTYRAIGLTIPASIPVKAVSDYGSSVKPIGNPTRFKTVTLRQAVAFAIAIYSQHGKIKPGVTSSRFFNLKGHACVIENGCTADAVASGLIDSGFNAPFDFVLNKLGSDYINQMVPDHILAKATTV